MGIKAGRREIRRGDEVRIVDENGREVRGWVESAVNCGVDHDENWYIVLRDKYGVPWYWKQGIDGGTIEILYIATID